jgi:hypothetical protein
LEDSYFDRYPATGDQDYDSLRLNRFLI